MKYVDDLDFTLYVGDVRDVLAGLPDESVHCVVTSPPYWGLRDYGTGSWDGGAPDCDHKLIERTMHAGRQGNAYGTPPGSGRMGDEYFKDVCGKCGARRVDHQIGLEPTPDLYVQNMVAVFREVRRVLRRDGTCWLNIGDSYSTDGGRGAARMAELGRPSAGITPAAARGTAPGFKTGTGLKEKDLCGIPWRLAFALQADGWYLRADIIWAKPNPMPESVTDRPTKAHEYVFLLTRSPRYFFDQEAVREPADPSTQRTTIAPNAKSVGDGLGMPYAAFERARYPVTSRNVRSVWEIATQPYAQAHFATFPEALVERCVKAGTSERGCCPVCGAPWEREVATSGGTIGKGWHGHEDDIGRGQRGGDNGNEAARLYKTYKRETTGWRPTCGHDHPPVPCVVLDPFMGSGTTALVARRLGRKAIGVELNPDYCALAARRLQQLSLLAV